MNKNNNNEYGNTVNQNGYQNNSNSEQQIPNNYFIDKKINGENNHNHLNPHASSSGPAGLVNKEFIIYDEKEGIIIDNGLREDHIK